MVLTCRLKLDMGRRVFCSILIIVFCVVQVLASTRPSSKECAIHKFLCRTGRSRVCSGDSVCTDIRVIRDPANNSTVKCEYVCESNVTSVPTPLNVTTPLPWRENSSYCNANFLCLHGGVCEKRNHTDGGTSNFCHCTGNWTGVFCHTNCSKSCDNGVCTKSINDTEQCNCDKGFTGKTCELRVQPSKSPPEKDQWFIPVFTCLSVLLFVAATYFFLQKLKWRSLFVTKLFHYLQPYEDDDGKEFDAFVSFRSSKKDYSQSEDEKFVLRVLQPMLEKEFRYKVCVHYRDFLPGETIANNIISAVENSRRTILILSPLYIESEWARMEYQKAQQEMLKMRHKIIPIIFDDISDITIDDPTLKHILSSVTYIHYPKNNDEKEHSKFWQMVGLALPKKHMPVEEEASSPQSDHQTLRLSSSQTLVSQESWQSARTDITDIEMDEVHDSNDFIEDVPEHVSIDVNVDVNEDDKISNKHLTDVKLENGKVLNNNVDKYISILERIS